MSLDVTLHQVPTFCLMLEDEIRISLHVLVLKRPISEFAFNVFTQCEMLPLISLLMDYASTTM